jgi:hypothetical protein
MLNERTSGIRSALFSAPQLGREPCKREGHLLGVGDLATKVVGRR